MPKKTASKSKSVTREKKEVKKVAQVKKTIKKASKSVTPVSSVKATHSSTTPVKNHAPAKTDSKRFHRTKTMMDVVVVRLSLSSLYSLKYLIYSYLILRIPLFF